MQRRWRFSVLVLLMVTMSVVSACGTASTSPSGTPLERWMAATPMYIAHRGGDGDWPEATGYAYAHATAWNPNLALEVPVWRTSDGVWVVSEDATTGRVFGANLPIPATRWAILSTLRSSRGSHPMARLVNDVLDVYGSNRILFIDNKADTNVTAFFDLLDSYGGRTRYVMKSYWQSTNTPVMAHQRRYLTWGYYYAKDMPRFAKTQSKFDLLGLDYTAQSADFQAMRATGKPVIAHIINNAHAASVAIKKGAQGLMVSAVEQVVPYQAVSG